MGRVERGLGGAIDRASADPPGIVEVGPEPVFTFDRNGCSFLPEYAVEVGGFLSAIGVDVIPFNP